MLCSGVCNFEGDLVVKGVITNCEEYSTGTFRQGVPEEWWQWMLCVRHVTSSSYGICVRARRRVSNMQPCFNYKVTANGLVDSHSLSRLPVAKDCYIPLH
jgi:hypothetical protein